MCIKKFYFFFFFVWDLKKKTKTSHVFFAFACLGVRSRIEQYADKTIQTAHDFVWLIQQTKVNSYFSSSSSLWQYLRAHIYLQITAMIFYKKYFLCNSIAFFSFLEWLLIDMYARIPLLFFFYFIYIETLTREAVLTYYSAKAGY